MVSTTNNNQCRGQSSTTIMMGKKVLLAALTIASASSLIATEAFQPPTMSASFGTSSSRADSTKLKYAVYERDQATTTTANAKSIELKKPKKSTKSKTIKTETVVDNHGYIVANHDNERDFWLHALQNLEPATTSKSNNHDDENDQSLWTRIACAYGPKEFREIRDIDSSSSSNSRIRQKDADLVRVGDTDLDITIAVPSDSNLESIENVVSSKERSGNRLVTIRVDFPEGKSFDKDAFSFEDELSAVIGQVRLLEQTANDKLSKLEE